MGGWGSGSQGSGGAAMRSPVSPFEVRCPRCDVSFPIETRRCIHCGGATSAPGAVVDVGAWAGPFESVGEGGAGPIGTTPAGPGDRAADEASQAPPQGLGASLLRTFGSLFWVVALVGFSILRSCGED